MAHTTKKLNFPSINFSFAFFKKILRGKNNITNQSFRTPLYRKIKAETVSLVKGAL
jgi:hypothetical protein